MREVSNLQAVLQTVIERFFRILSNQRKSKRHSLVTQSIIDIRV